MNKPVNPTELQLDDDGPLYVAQKKVYPQSVSGTFRRTKWGLMAFCLGVYYLLPFVRWNRGLGAPDQAVLVDLPNSRFYFFFIELWPQEVYYFTGLLIVAALTLFLMNAVGGRIWCGYLCPQTVWTDLFYAVERLDRRRPARAHAQGCRQGHDEARALRRDPAEAFDLADDRLVDRRRLGALFQRRADAGEAARHLPGADDRLYLDRHPDGDDLCLRRLDARAGLRLHVPVAAHSGRAHRRVGAQRHLQIRSRRSAHVAEEGERAARARPAGRRLHRLLSVRGRVPDRHRYPRRIATRLHPVRPVHRCLRYRDDQDRPGNPADRLRQRHQHPPARGRQAADLPHRAAAHHHLCRDDRRPSARSCSMRC